MNCRQGAARMCDQIVDILDIVGDDEYSRPLQIYNGSSVGNHFRHIFDFFNCLVGINNDDLDYCNRERDERIATIRGHARNEFIQLKKDISQLDEGKEITVHADFEVEDGLRPVVKSTIGRELMYAYDHAVHHLAIVKIGLKSINPQIVINKNLGVAASTIRHQHLHG